MVTLSGVFAVNKIKTPYYNHINAVMNVTACVLFNLAYIMIYHPLQNIFCDILTKINSMNNFFF